MSPLLCRNLTDIVITPSIPTILVNMIRMIEYTDPDYKAIESYCHVLDVLGELYASLTQGGALWTIFTLESLLSVRTHRMSLIILRDGEDPEHLFL